MIKWKTLKFKHYRQWRALEADGNGSEPTDEATLEFALQFVAEWDFKDEETGQPVSTGNLDELSIPQMIELFDSFNNNFKRSKYEIPKVPAAP